MFKELYEHNYRYLLKKWTVITFFNNRKEQGIIAEDVDVSELHELNSVVEVRCNYKKGEFVPVTRDLATNGGYLILVHQSWDQIVADIKALREFEAAKVEIIPLAQDDDQDETSSQPEALQKTTTQMSILCSSPRDCKNEDHD